MTEFDHLIKEKAEQAQYKFRPSAWKSFLQYSGIKAGLAAWQIAAIITAAVVTGGTVTYSVLKHSSSKNVEPAEQFTEQVAADTTEEVIEMVEEPDTEEITEPENTVKENPVTVQKRTNTVVKEPVVEDPKVVEQPKETPKKKRYYGRPVIIDVDTITVMEPTDEELRKGHSRLF